MKFVELPTPPHFDPEKASKVWKVEYQKIADASINWKVKHEITPSSDDRIRVCLVAVDVQNTFCIPDFELYVAGRSGTGAVDDNRRLCDFIYRNLNTISQIIPTMDTHQAFQIFHSIFLVDEKGEHPLPFTTISQKDILSGKWKFNSTLGENLELNPAYMKGYLEHYTKQLKESGKYELTIWPYHAMLGGIGHALVSSVEEAIFFHTICRDSQPHIHVKGNHTLTEHYSVLGPEVSKDQKGRTLVDKNETILHDLLEFDIVIIAGQAKSHCVAWTISDLLEDVKSRDESLVQKFYLLEDCTSPVVIPGVIDYTDEADSAFKRFKEDGMNIVKSTDPILSWPGIKKLAAA